MPRNPANPPLLSSIPSQESHPQDLIWEWSSLALSESQVLQLGNEKTGIWNPQEVNLGDETPKFLRNKGSGSLGFLGPSGGGAWMPGLRVLWKELLTDGRPGTLPPMQGPPLPQAPFHPCLPVRFLDPHPTSFPLPQWRLFEKKQRRKRQEPLMVQANPDASVRPRRPRRREKRFSADSGEERCPEPGRRAGWRAGPVGVWWGLGLKGLEGRGLVELAEGGGALIDLWVGPVRVRGRGQRDRQCGVWCM